jgi:hypothetical protein
VSDKKEEYTNFDLDTADELLVAAGYPSIAKALRHQTQGNRNLIQGEWGSRVVEAFENILQARVVAVLTSVQQRLDEQIGLVQQLITMTHGANARLGKVEKVVAALKKGQTASDKQMAVVVKQLEQLGALAEKTNYLAEEHNRIAAEQNRLATIANDLARDVADLKAWRAELEARDHAK